MPNWTSFPAGAITIQMHSVWGGGVPGWFGGIIWVAMFGPSESLKYTCPPQPKFSSLYSNWKPEPEVKNEKCKIKDLNYKRRLLYWKIINRLIYVK